MKAVKLNDEQAEVVREFTEHANELSEKYKKLAKDLRAVEYLIKDNITWFDNLRLLAWELEETKKLRVNEKNILYDGGDYTDKAHFIDAILYRLYEIRGHSALIEPYVTINIKDDILELCFKMRNAVEAIIAD